MIHGLPMEKQAAGRHALWRVARFGHIVDVPPSIVPPDRLAELYAMFDRLHACHDSSRHTTS
jgi:hypothetical protein